MTSVKTVPERGTTHDLDYTTTDSGNADRLVREHGRDFRYCPALGGWLTWNGVRWEIDKDAAAIFRSAESMVRPYCMRRQTRTTRTTRKPCGDAADTPSAHRGWSVW